MEINISVDAGLKADNFLGNFPVNFRGFQVFIHTRQAAFAVSACKGRKKSAPIRQRIALWLEREH